jgi:hypothetical protein
MDCSLESRDGIRLKYHDDEPDGRARIRMSRTAQPSPGVALRLRTVIDCTPGEEPVPPVTIEFVNNNLPPAGEAAHQVTAARFMFSCDEYIAFSKQLRAVEGMLAAAGLPRECTSSVNEFCRLSAASAINMYYASVAITVEADAPENVVDDEDEEVVPDGADTGDCAICYSEYVVGGATSVKLPCGHVYHRKCIDKWTRVDATCPYCRTPVPVPEEDCFWDDEDCHPADDTHADEARRGDVPSSAWARIGGTARLVPSVFGFLSAFWRGG